MPITNLSDSDGDSKKLQKEIETGILKAIADMTNEDAWPDGADAYDIQLIITQLARSAAHLRDASRMDNERFFTKKGYPQR